MSFEQTMILIEIHIFREDHRRYPTVLELGQIFEKTLFRFMTFSQFCAQYTVLCQKKFIELNDTAVVWAAKPERF